MLSFDEAHNMIERAAIELGFYVAPDSMETYLLSSEQMLAPLSFGVTPERYLHWSFGKKAEIFSNWLKRGKLNPVSLDCFIPSTPARAFVLGDMSLAKQVSAIARIYACLDFAKQNNLWKNRDFNEAWEEAREHARIIEEIAKSVGDEKLDKTLTTAHWVAYQCAHSIALAGRTGDFLEEIAAHSPKLESWQRDVLRIVHREWVWFLPATVETLLMMKGYAATCLMPLIRAAGLPDSLRLDCILELTQELAVPTLEGQINPSNVGYEIFYRIFKSECGKNMKTFREKIADIIAEESDKGLVAKYLTYDAARDSGLFSFGQRSHSGQDSKVLEIKELADLEGWKKVRDELVKVVGGNIFPALHIIRNDSFEFRMKHEFDGRTLNRVECDEVMKALNQFLGVSVVLETVKVDSSGKVSQQDTWSQPHYYTSSNANSGCY